MAKYVCVCMVCMNAVCIDEGMGFPLGCQNWRAFRLMAYFEIWATDVNHVRVGMTQVDTYRVKNSYMYIVVLSTKK
jgi:hypothetical protein